MKKNGFTLVELLAVIAILAILVIIALPNVMGMFNKAKENSFKTEIKEIYKTAQNQWMQDSMFKTDEKVYSRCKSGCTNSLDLSGRSELEYYIKLNKSGKVVKYYATDGTFQYSYSGNELLITEINNIDKIAEIDSSEIITISNNTISNIPESDGIIYPDGKNMDTVIVGDILKIKDQEFYVIKNNSSSLNLLARYNLNIGDYANNNVEKGIQHETIKGAGSAGSYGTISFASTNYWNNKVGDGKEYNGEYCTYNSGTNCVYVEDSNSYIHEHLINYNNWIGLDNVSIRLLTVQEAVELGCEWQINDYVGSCRNAPDWVSNTSYWLGNPINFNAPWVISLSGNEYNFGASNRSNMDNYYGIRPVLVISK